MEVIVKRTEKFSVLYDLPVDTEFVCCIGGRGGGKTYEVSKFVAFSVAVKGKRCQVLRDEKEGIKESILNEVLLRWDSANKQNVLDRQFSRLENGIKNNKTGEMAVFTKGFRASTLDKKANMKAVSNVDIAVIEEGEDIRDEDKFNTFSDSIRKEGSYIIFIMNTPDIYHWVVRRYFHAVPITVDDEPLLSDSERSGYFKLVPRDVRGFVAVQCNYSDNTFLPEKTVRQYEAYGDPDSHLYNLHHYLTSIKGYSTTGLKGQIFKNYDIIKPEEFMSLDCAECYGLDFGTTSPAGVIWVKIHGDHVYLKELNYEGLALVPLAKKLNDLGFTDETLIIADCAEPHTIRHLREGVARYLDEGDCERYPYAALGFRNILPSPEKGIAAGIEKLLSMKIHITSDSPNMIAEASQYVWAVDKDGKPSGKPIDNHNHLWDPVRYVIQVHGRLF